MSQLTEYIEETKKKTKGLNEIEKIRYVYLDLGKRFQFDLKFAFGNSKTKKKIYTNSRGEENLSECLVQKTGICKSISLIFENVLEQIDVPVKSIVDPEEYIGNRHYPHMYNIYTTDDGRQYGFDLQRDIKRIKAHIRTVHFAKPINTNQELISRFELEQIDKKLQYITNKVYYTDEYLELLKTHMNLYESFEEKAKFMLENVEFYCDSNMGYADRKWRLEELIGNGYKDGKLLQPKEARKIHLIDCCQEKNGKKEYQLLVAVDAKKEEELYLFSDQEKCFVPLSIEKFEKMKQEGLENLQGIPKLKKRRKQNQEKER